MILLDALYINNSGGKVLLDYLVSKLHESGKDIFYLLDHRVKGDFDYLPKEKVFYLPNSLLRRHRFYKANKDSFSTVLCFGNIPPSLRMNARVYTYFHNTVLFFCADYFPVKEKLLYKIKSLIIRFLEKHTDHWLVQTEEVTKLFRAHWKIEENKIKQIPFFKPVEYLPGKNHKDQNAYVFISDGHPNKMHLQLLEGFALAQKKIPGLKLYLTISNQYPVLNKHIADLKTGGVNVFNLGWCPPAELKQLYEKSAFLIFPSVQESFGLGLIEAAQYDLKVIASDLPFVHAVIEPSLVFNPYDPDSIAKAILKSQKEKIPPTQLFVKNRVDGIIHLLA